MSFDFEKLRKSWPAPIVARTEIARFTGGLLNARTMANLDSLGEGPPRGRYGRKIFYPVDSLVAWMEARSAEPGQRSEKRG